MRNTIKSIQLYRGTTQQHSDYAGPVGEITVDTAKYTVVVQNGATGGVPLARESDVTAEAQAREAADTALQKSVTDEVSARETADNAFYKQIDDAYAVISAAYVEAGGTLDGYNHTLQQIIALAVKTAVLQAKKETILECRPIGSYFLTETEDDPNVIFAGGWEKLTGRYVLQCSDDTHAAGTTVKAGLPNIKGKATYINSDGVDQNMYPDSGAFYWGRYNAGILLGSSGTGKRDLMLDASRSNPIYGRSDTVQPPARIVNVWKRVS